MIRRAEEYLCVRWSEAIERNDRLCENSIGALRPGSGRTDKYFISNDTTPFVVSLVEP
jgi:hypothetical protein